MRIDVSSANFTAKSHFQPPLRCPPLRPPEVRGFEKGLAEGGLATNSAQNTAKIAPQKRVLLLIRGTQEKRCGKGLNLCSGMDFLGPIPSVHQPLFKCPESVPGVSRSVREGTLFGHSGARGPKGRVDTLSDTRSDTPRFRGHSRGHSGDTSGPRNSCSRPGASQFKMFPFRAS